MGKIGVVPDSRLDGVSLGELTDAITLRKGSGKKRAKKKNRWENTPMSYPLEPF
jgi:hypothetical protein